jgi:hypothetical protein
VTAVNWYSLAKVPVEFPQFLGEELKELKELPNPTAISADVY